LLRYFPLQAKALRASGRSPSGGRQRGIVAGRASIGVVARIDDTVHVGRVYVCHRARWPVGAARVIKGVEARRLRLSPFTLTRCPRLRLLLANAGNDKRAIKDWLGHRSTQHAVDYTELTPTRFKTFWSACPGQTYRRPALSTRLMDCVQREPRNAQRQVYSSVSFD
jgi:hypothetical protein